MTLTREQRYALIRFAHGWRCSIDVICIDCALHINYNPSNPGDEAICTRLCTLAMQHNPYFREGFSGICKQYILDNSTEFPAEDIVEALL